MIRILAIPGSLRAVSTNKSVLKAVDLLKPEGVEITLFSGLGDLPHFNPDLEAHEPQVVTDFRALVKAADGVLISSPEYAHGVPGSLKNALDWLVGGSEIYQKPVALLNASPRSTHAQASLAETLTTMGVRLVSEASVTVPLTSDKKDEAAMLADPEISNCLHQALVVFVSVIQKHEISDAPESYC